MAFLHIFAGSNVYNIQSAKTGTGTVHPLQVLSTAGVTVDDYLQVNGAVAPANVSLVVGHTTAGNRDRVQFFVGGSTGANDSPDDTHFWVKPTTTNIAGAQTLGVVSTVRIDKLTYAQSSGGSGGTFSVAASLYVADAVAMPPIGPGSGYTGSTYAVYVAAGTSHFADAEASNLSIADNGTFGTTGITYAYSFQARPDIVAFFGVSGAGQQAGGAATAGGSYTGTEQGMINRMYSALRTFGLLS
jgi:hypothetical protein